MTGIGYPTQDITKKLDLRVLNAINSKLQRKIGEKLRNFSNFGGTKSGRYQNQSLYELQGCRSRFITLDHLYYFSTYENNLSNHRIHHTKSYAVQNRRKNTSK